MSSLLTVALLTLAGLLMEFLTASTVTLRDLDQTTVCTTDYLLLLNFRGEWREREIKFITVYRKLGNFLM